MTEQLRMQITLGPRSDEPTERLVARVIGASQSAFQPLLLRLLDAADEGTVLVEDSLQVESISLGHGSGSAAVRFDSAFFAACRDLRSTSSHRARLPFTTDGTRLLFEIDLPPRWGDPL